MSWIKRTLWEIERSSSLAILGGLFSAAFMVMYYFWSSQNQLFLGESIQPLLCWDFLPQCSEKIPIPGEALNWAYKFSLFTALIAMPLFFMRRGIGFAWFCLSYSWAVYLLIFSLDASLRSNILGFFPLLVFGFLFVPNKQKIVRYLLVAFYFMDVYTKLNAGWLSGLPLFGSLDVPLKGLEWIASFSVLIQLVMPFFLVSKDGQRMGYGLAALFIYHLSQYYMQQDPGQLVLAMVLIFFIFNHFENKRIQFETMYQSYEHPEPSSIWWPILIILFGASQLTYAEGRFPLVLFQLQKPTGSMECQVVAYAKYQDQTVEMDIQENSIPAQFKCHTMVNFNLVKSYCESFKKENSFNNITAFFMTRSLGEEKYQVRFQSDRFCDSSFKNPSMGGPNESQ